MPKYYPMKATYLFMAVLGVAAFGVVIFDYRASRIDPNWVRTEGRVTTFERASYGRSSTSAAHEVIEYEVGQEVKTLVSPVAAKAGAKVGDRRVVAYSSANPHEAKLVTGLRPLSFLSIAFGIVLIVGAGLGLRAKR